MRKLIVICATLLLASPAFAVLDLSQSDYTSPYTQDYHTMGLWHFDQPSSTAPLPDDTTYNNTASFLDNYDSSQAYAASMAGFDTAIYTYTLGGTNENAGQLSTTDWTGVKTSSLNSGGGDLTVECWWNPSTNANSSGRMLVFKHTGGDFALNYYTTTSLTNVLGLQWYGDTWRTVMDTVSATLNTWSHIAVTIDRNSSALTDTIKFWHNGQLSTTHVTPYVGGDPNDKPLRMLGYPNYPGSNMSFWGMLDEVRVSNAIRVPEPTTFSLLAIALLTLLRRKK
jgi:hypothetical protein